MLLKVIILFWEQFQDYSVDLLLFLEQDEKDLITLDTGLRLCTRDATNFYHNMKGLVLCCTHLDGNADIGNDEVGGEKNKPISLGHIEISNHSLNENPSKTKSTKKPVDWKKFKKENPLGN